MKKKIPKHIKDLHEQDTEKNTFGCKHSNPESCRYNDQVGICAFVDPKNICKKPPRSWAETYRYLKELEQAPLSTNQQ